MIFLPVLCNSNSSFRFAVPQGSHEVNVLTIPGLTEDDLGPDDELFFVSMPQDVSSNTILFYTFLLNFSIDTKQCYLC